MRQPHIRHNNYGALNVPALGEWTPQLGVSVVIPSFGHQDKLDLALASLAAQTYPGQLIEVLVVDDGSTPPIRLPELRPQNSRLIRTAPGAWGSAHAVNTGVAAASHDVILRLDADMLVCREHVEAHMRWHHLADYLTVLGTLVFTGYEMGALKPADVLEAVANSKTEDLFDPEQAQVSWVEEVYKKTNNLLEAGNRAFRVADGATISFSRRLYDDSGPLDTRLLLGSDTEFGYRLAQAGAVFVPERQAKGWHLGLSQMNSLREEARRFRAPFVGHRTPLLGDFRRERGRQFSVPYVEMVIDAETHSFEDVKASVVGAFTGSLTDVRVTLVGPWGTLPTERRSLLDDPWLDLILVHETFAGDSRVRFAESAPETSFPAPFGFRCPAGLVLTHDALSRLIEEADKNLYGLILLPFPRDRMLPIARLERTEAFARARGLQEPGEDLENLVHDLFGVHWISGTDWALTLASDAVRPPTIGGLLAEADKWKRTAELRKTYLDKCKKDAAAWKQAAQVPLKVRLRRAVRRRIRQAFQLDRPVRDA